MGDAKASRLGVVVLTYRSYDELEACLSALLPDLPLGTPVVVVDNASQDGTVERTKERFPDVIVLANSSNAGYGSGMNAGLRALAPWSVDHYLLLTHDALVREGAVSQLLRVLDERPSCAVAGPLLLTRDPRDRIWSAGGRLSRLSGRPSHQGAGAHCATWAGENDLMVDWLDGAALLIRAAALNRLPGPFDSDYFLYWEEVELQHRLRDAGWHVRLVPGAIVEQRPGCTPPYLASRNRIRYLVRRGSPLRAAAATADILARAVALLAFSDRRWQARVRAHGAVDGWTGRLDRGLATRR